MIKLALGTPAYRRQIDAGHRAQDLSYMFVSALSEGAFMPVGVLHSDGCSVAHGRNQILYQALHSGADWLLMQDADTIYAPTSQKLDMSFTAPVFQAIADAHNQQAAVVAAAVEQRQQGAVTWNVIEGERRLEESEFRDRVVAVDAIGTAFMAINLKWIGAHFSKAPWFHMLHGSVAETGAPAKMGEDIFFCKQVRARGGVILCDGRLRPRHVGLGATGHEGDRTIA